MAQKTNKEQRDSWGRKYIDKYIYSYLKEDTIGYRVWINRHDLKVNERFETLAKAIAYRDEALRLCEVKRLEKLKVDLDIKDYPYNLIEVLEFDVENVIEHFEERLSVVLNQGAYTEREINILNRVYQDQITLEEISREWNITRERARQILSKSIRRLKCRKGYFETGKYSTPEALAKEQYEEYANSLKNKWTYESAKEFIRNYEQGHQEEIKNEMAIEELDFSVRTYKCLRRTGIKTISDISKKMADDLYKIRNMGRKSLKEIILKMNELGFEIENQEIFGIVFKNNK